MDQAKTPWIFQETEPNNIFPSGCYTVDDFQMSFPECDALDLLQVLEALHLCTQVLSLSLSTHTHTHKPLTEFHIKDCYGNYSIKGGVMKKKIVHNV